MTGNRSRSVISRTLFGLLALLAILVALSAVVAFARIQVDLSEYKDIVESSASDALGRPVRIDGRIGVTTSLWPSLEIEQVRIPNPKGFEEGNLAQMERASLRVALLPLLTRKLHIRAFRVEGLTLDLRKDATGANNWANRSPDKPKAPAEPAPEGDLHSVALASDSLVVGDLSLSDIAVSYRSDDREEPLVFRIDQCTGAAPAGKPFTLDMQGNLFSEPFTTHLAGSSLQEFLEQNRSRMEIETGIAGARVRLAGLVDLSSQVTSYRLEVSLEGDRLDKLNGLVGLELPALAEYRAAATLSASPGKAELTDLEIAVRDSALTGSLSIDRASGQPVAQATLRADTIQIDDFDIGAWSPDDAGAAQPEEESATDMSEEDDPPDEAGTANARENAELLSPEVLERLDANLDVTVGEVRSGTDLLGSGTLQATLTQGRISVDTLKLELPGGSVLMNASFKPDPQASDASLRVLIERFDIGLLARLRDPDTKLGGEISLDLDLRGAASTPDQILAGGNGYIHVSARPEHLRAGILDLWAVNLIASIVSETDSEDDDEASQINCLLSRWSMTGGRLAADSLVIDTSRIRICGEGYLDFAERRIDLTAAPTPKRPEFFSAATPVVAKGAFGDYRLGVKRGAVAGTALRFLTSPITTPIKRLAGHELPADGADICELPIGPDIEAPEKMPGC